MFVYIVLFLLEETCIILIVFEVDKEVPVLSYWLYEAH